MDVMVGAQSVTLSPVRPAALSAAERIDTLEGLARLRAWADAQEQHLLAAMAGPGDPPRSLGDPVAVEKQYVREEIACVLRLAPSTVNARLHLAGELVRRLPDTLAALERGVIELAYARCLGEAVNALPDAAAMLVEKQVLPAAGGQTLRAFRESVARAVLAVDPRTAEQQHTDALQERRVEARMSLHGMGSVHAELPADAVTAIMTRVQAAADAATTPDDGRTADQRRADAFVALVLGQDPASAASWQGRRPTVQVSVALSTLLNLDDAPGELDGYGPVPAQLARRMAADPSGTWRRLVTDPLGGVIDAGRQAYEPPQGLAEHVIARDRICRFPGCRRQARRCDIDHQTAWDDHGKTDACNLECLCSRHHHLKHEAGWTVRGDPDGHLTWTTPTGHTYLDPPGRHPIDSTMTASVVDDCPF